VAVSILMWIIIYSVCKIIKTRIQCIQNPGGADFWPQSAFLPCTGSSVLPLMSDRFCGLYIPIPENLPGVKRISNTLACFVF